MLFSLSHPLQPIIVRLSRMPSEAGLTLQALVAGPAAVRRNSIACFLTGVVKVIELRRGNVCTRVIFVIDDILLLVLLLIGLVVVFLCGVMGPFPAVEVVKACDCGWPTEFAAGVSSSSAVVPVGRRSKRSIRRLSRQSIQRLEE